jgi:hypothetical protein
MKGAGVQRERDDRLRLRTGGPGASKGSWADPRRRRFSCAAAGGKLRSPALTCARTKIARSIRCGVPKREAIGRADARCGGRRCASGTLVVTEGHFPTPQRKICSPDGPSETARGGWHGLIG